MISGLMLSHRRREVHLAGMHIAKSDAEKIGPQGGKSKAAQGRGVFPNLTVEENLSAGLVPASFPPPERSSPGPMRDSHG